MTVSTAYTVLSFAGNGSTTAFAVSWPFLTGSLVVTLVASTGVETTQTLTTHYTVSGGTDSNGLPGTGTVTMLTAPASGQTLRITRATPKTQASTWGENDAFPQKTIEAALDKLTLAVQESSSTGTVNDGIGGDVMELVTSGATDYWDAESQIIRNVADAVEATDAVNYGQLQAFAIAAGAGDVVGPASSVDGELVLFDGVTGKQIKRATTTGLLKAASGVVSAATAGTDYLAPGAIGFLANKGGTDQTGVADATFTKVTFGTEVYDNGSYFASSAWTPPAGLVSISAAFLASGTWSAGAQIAIAIRKNASTPSLAQANWYSAAANAGAAFISVEDDANGTDYYEVFAYVDVGSGTATIAGTSNNTYFVGHVIK